MFDNEIISNMALEKGGRMLDGRAKSWERGRPSWDFLENLVCQITAWWLNQKVLPSICWRPYQTKWLKASWSSFVIEMCIKLCLLVRAINISNWCICSFNSRYVSFLIFTGHYSLSDPFPLFLLECVSVSHPNLANPLGIYLLSVSTP